MHPHVPEAYPSVFEEPQPQPQPPKPYEPMVEVKQNAPVESSPKQWYEVRPPPIPPPPAEETEIEPQFTKPVKSILKHDPVNYHEPAAPEPAPVYVGEERSQSFEQPQTRHYQQPRPAQTHVRSWNDFESSLRKKSMELIEHRPAAKPHEPPREAPKPESEPYKLKRPNEYLPKQQWNQGRYSIHHSVFNF